MGVVHRLLRVAFQAGHRAVAYFGIPATISTWSRSLNFVCFEIGEFRRRSHEMKSSLLSGHYLA